MVLILGSNIPVMTPKSHPEWGLERISQIFLIRQGQFKIESSQTYFELPRLSYTMSLKSTQSPSFLI